MSHHAGVTTCPHCGSPVPPAAAFCGVCGGLLAGRTPSAPPGPSAPDPDPGPVLVPVAGPALPAPFRPAASQVAPDRAGRPGDFVPAGIGARLAALVIDQAAVGVLAGVTFAVAYAVGRSGTADGSVGRATAGYAGAMLAPGLVSAASCVFQWVWEARAGRTIGNSLLGLRTWSGETGRPAGLGKVFLRLLIQGLGSIACLVGTYVVAASGAWDASGRRQGWHDKVAGTIVVKVGAGSASDAAARPRAGAMSPVVVAPVRPDELARDAFGPPLAVTPGASGELIASVPGFSVPPPAVRAALAPVPAAEVAPAPAAHRPREADSLRERDDVDSTRLVDRYRGAAAHALVLDTGERVVVTGDGVIGRNPSHEPGAGATQLVPLVDTTRSVSKTHLAFGIDTIGLWVTDLHSTNGSAVVTVSGERSQLAPGIRAHVSPGDVVELGDRSLEVAG